MDEERISLETKVLSDRVTEDITLLIKKYDLDALEIGSNYLKNYSLIAENTVLCQHNIKEEGLKIGYKALKKTIDDYRSVYAGRYKQ